MKYTASFLLATSLLAAPCVGRSQEVSWRLLSTTGGLVVAPSYPSPGNVHYFERQQLRNTVRVSSFVHPSTFYRVAARSGDPGVASPAAPARERQTGG